MSLIKTVLRLPERFAHWLKHTGFGRTTLGRWCVDAVLFPYDWRLVRRKYAYVFGRTPRLLSPQTFNEHITSNKLFGRNSVQVKLADKLAVRDYVASRIGEQYLCEVLWEGTNVADIPRAVLPSRFVLKANNISGDVAVCRDKSSFDWSEAERRAGQWLESDYSVEGGEWQYRWIAPRLFIEEFLEDGSGDVPADYKFFCFGGEVKFLQVDRDRFTGHRRAMLDRNFQPLPFGLCYPRYEGALTKPKNFGEMISLAEKLAEGFRFVRVDFYDAGCPVFGEMTFHPDGGIGKFDPPEWDEKLGKLFSRNGAVREA